METQDLLDSLHLARCAVNAETMQHGKHYIKKTAKPKTVAIIGGGIGGMEAARVLKLRGHNPVIYEKAQELGVHSSQPALNHTKESSATSLPGTEGRWIRWASKSILGRKSKTSSLSRQMK